MRGLVQRFRSREFNKTGNNNPDHPEIQDVGKMIADARVTSDRLDAVVKQVYKHAATLQNIVERTISIEQDVQNQAFTALATLQTSRKETDRIASAAGDMRSSIVELQVFSDATQELMQSVFATLQSNQQIFQDLRRAILAIENTVNHFSQDAGRIRDIHEMLVGLTEQTKLLALNASIEAAHAGQYGAGFSVIAHAIRRLSDESHIVVGQSDEILETMEQGVHDILNRTKNSHSVLQEFVQSGESTSLRVSELAAKYEQVNGLISQTGDGMVEQTHSSESIHTQVSAAESNIESMMKVVVQTLDSMEEEKIQIDELIQLAEHLQATSDELGESIQDAEHEVYGHGMSIPTERLRTIKKFLHELVNSEHILSMAVPSHERLFHQVMQEHREIEAIWSNLVDGAFLCSIPPAGLVNASTRTWWQASMKGEDYVSEPYISAITKGICITVSVPIRDLEGNISGCLGVDVAVEQVRFS